MKKGGACSKQPQTTRGVRKGPKIKVRVALNIMTLLLDRAFCMLNFIFRKRPGQQRTFEISISGLTELQLGCLGSQGIAVNVQALSLSQSRGLRCICHCGPS